jgi:hypothetical protein
LTSSENWDLLKVIWQAAIDQDYNPLIEFLAKRVVREVVGNADVPGGLKPLAELLLGDALRGRVPDLWMITDALGEAVRKENPQLAELLDEMQKVVKLGRVPNPKELEKLICGQLGKVDKGTAAEIEALLKTLNEGMPSDDTVRLLLGKLSKIDERFRVLESVQELKEVLKKEQQADPEKIVKVVGRMAERLKPLVPEGKARDQLDAIAHAGPQLLEALAAMKGLKEVVDQVRQPGQAFNPVVFQVNRFENAFKIVMNAINKFDKGGGKGNQDGGKGNQGGGILGVVLNPKVVAAGSVLLLGLFVYGIAKIAEAEGGKDPSGEVLAAFGMNLQDVLGGLVFDITSPPRTWPNNHPETKAIIYILVRKSDGVLLKVGIGKNNERLQGRGNRPRAIAEGIEVTAHVLEFKISEVNDIEKKVREVLRRRGHQLPWDQSHMEGFGPGEATPDKFPEKP